MNKDINKQLSCVLEQFDMINREYATRYSNPAKGEFDLAYFYNERTNISILSGAIWRQNPTENLVLEEYSCDKEPEANRYKGRRDLWFCLGETQFRCEAKQRWWALDTIDESKFEAVLNLANDEFQKVEEDHHGYENNNSLGIVFVTLTLTRRNLKDATRHINNLNGLIDAHRKDDLLIHKLILEDVLEAEGDVNKLYPGVLVIIKKQRVLSPS